MMGRTHVFSGLAVGALALPFAPTAGLPSTLAWVAVVGGAAMLPDLDHPNATVTHMWGVASAAIARAVHVLGSGHRGGAHDILIAPLVVGGLAWVASRHPVGAGLFLALAIGLAVRGCEFVIPGRTFETAIANLAVSAIGAWATVTYTAGTAWLPYALALGVAVHIAGDALTRQGVPVPLTWLAGKPRTTHGPLTTGHWYEAWLIAPALLMIAAIALWHSAPELAKALDA